jgi:aspartokinase-like uncharacterized kinase
MWVVKLGGSLSREPRLKAWLAMLAEVGGGRVLVVPGGARFADAVREVQTHWQFDDLAAHNMAVLAMAQTAHLLHALEPRLAFASDEPDIRRVLHAGQAALWMPLGLLRDAPDVLTSWDVTSDSLALWFALRLNAEALVVVKACDVPSDFTLAQLTAIGTVDPRFADWAKDAPFPIEVIPSTDIDRVRDGLLVGPSFLQPDLTRAFQAARTRRNAGATRTRRKTPPA